MAATAPRSVLQSILAPTSERANLYMRYRIERGMVERYGPGWANEYWERPHRLAREIAVIEAQGFSSYFLILANIMQWCREQGIPYGPGRGSVGGSYAAFALGIHEMDSLEWDLPFARFMNPERVAHPDVDIDVSQRHREKVLDFIREKFSDDETAVLQVAAFARAGARRTIDMVATAMAQQDPGAMAIATELKKLLPEGNNITGGTKQEREITWWLEHAVASKKQKAKVESFVALATKAGWLEHLLKLDGVQTHLTNHAAGVVIVRRSDLAMMPQTGTRTTSGEWRMMTGYDMYSLEALKYLKIDILGLRTLDILSDAHKFCGGDGSTPALMDLWHKHREDPAIYELLCQGDTMGVFQVETSGYRKTLKEFQPKCFKHIVHLNALYRPGALDYTRPDGKNMVEVFIDRLHGREPIAYAALKDKLAPILDETQGIILYQEQAMRIATDLAGFSDAEADNLRKAIGKKQLDRMARIKPQFLERTQQLTGCSAAAADSIWENIAAAGRYSWNRSHSVSYGCITDLCALFKGTTHLLDDDLGLDGPGKAAFYAALINSLEEDKDRQADAVAEARQHVTLRPPDINVAIESYTLDDEGHIVFGLNGIRGIGEANRDAIVLDRFLYGPYKSFQHFQERLPSVPINMKLSLVQCGAFDSLEDRGWLLATCLKPNGQTWTVAEFIKHNCGLKKPRPLPSITDLTFPTERDLAEGERQAVGFYLAKDPMAEVNQALGRLDPDLHWGGQIESVKIQRDRRDQEMAKFTLLTPALTKLQCLIFSSKWPQCRPLCNKGERVILRGRMDDGKLLVDAIFRAGDYRHFGTIRLSRDGQEGKREPFDGKLETIQLAEASGYTVNLR